MKHYDIIIIGSGGGTKLRPLSEKGRSIAIIEKAEMGGTCLNRGCIPSKMLIYPSDLATTAREHAADLHVHGLETPKVDFKSLVEETQQRISKNSNSIAPFYESQENITLYKGHARFIENKIVEVDGQQISADTIYIATGSVPTIPNIEGLEGTPYMTSKDALANSDLPKKMIVIGGGYIAVELGHVYGAAGCDTHFLVRSGMIKAEDKDVRDVFEKDFANRYNVHFGVSPVKVEYSDGIFSVTLDNGEIMQSDALFVATGVKPMTEGLGLENTSVTLSARGYIEVDEYLQTEAEGVYALGDVVGNYLFRHSVNYEGEYLLREYNQEAKSPIKYPPIPHAIFTYPQIAGVGFTQDELIKQGKTEGEDYEVALHNYKNSAMGDAMKAEVGFVKLIAEKSTGKILGAHILGDKSSDIIHMMIVIISAGETVDFMLNKMIFIHPALSEVIRNAARTLSKKI
ncbi:dihydrolipoyl dehydrogenase [Candidatus Gracilibacteria bacterium]|nr:dihydrolipoyl dehydrogenase [Candidatus Gracilibacteria bacterium]